MSNHVNYNSILQGPAACAGVSSNAVSNLMSLHIANCTELMEAIIASRHCYLSRRRRLCHQQCYQWRSLPGSLWDSAPGAPLQVRPWT